MIWTTGCGKSSIPARLLALDLQTMGVPATFLEPGNILHGGMGGIKDNDSVYFFSESGETRELVEAARQILQNTQALTIYVGATEQSSLKLMCGGCVRVQVQKTQFGSDPVSMCAAARNIAAHWKKTIGRFPEWAHPANRSKDCNASGSDAIGNEAVLEPHAGD